MPENPSPDFYFGIAGCIMSFFALIISVISLFYSRKDKAEKCSVSLHLSWEEIPRDDDEYMDLLEAGMFDDTDPEIFTFEAVLIAEIINTGFVPLHPEKCWLKERNTSSGCLMFEEDTEKDLFRSSGNFRQSGTPIEPSTKRRYKAYCRSFKPSRITTEELIYVADFTLQNGKTFHSDPLKVNVKRL